MDKALLQKVFGISTSYRATGVKGDGGVVEIGVEPGEKLFV